MHLLVKKFKKACVFLLLCMGAIHPLTSLMAQGPKRIQGVITDSKGIAVPSVTVSLKGTNTVTRSAEMVSVTHRCTV